MAKHKSAQKLQWFALVFLKRHLLKMLVSKSPDLTDAFLTQLTQNLTVTQLEKLIDSVLHDLKAEPATKLMALRGLMTRRVKRLRLAHFHTKDHSQITDFLVGSCTNVESLDLRGVWLGDQDKVMFVKAISSMGNLTKLILNYVADDAILEAIGR